MSKWQLSRERERDWEQTKRAEGFNTKEVQHSQAFVASVGSAKPKTPVGDKRYHNGSYQLSLIGQAFCFT